MGRLLVLGRDTHRRIGNRGADGPVTHPLYGALHPPNVPVMSLVTVPRLSKGMRPFGPSGFPRLGEIERKTFGTQRIVVGLRFPLKTCVNCV